MHGGGFYHSQKNRVAPPAIPATLHWFKWEAYTTLLSGLFLLVVVYYANAEAYLVDPAVATLSAPVAIVTSAAFLLGGWLVYDGLCRSPLARRGELLAAVIAALCVAMAYALCHLFSGRAAFLHFGAVLGTIMVLNVFFIIIPGQRAMVASATAGTPPDPAHGIRGKQRSVHNTYFTLPVLFAMISNHYAWLFGHAYNWVALLAMSLAGALIRVFFVARHKGRAPALPLIFALALLVAVAVALRPRKTASASAPTQRAMLAIVTERCTPCHSATPSFAGFAAAPKGIALESDAQVTLHGARIREQVASRAMPLGNLTRMTDAEREQLIGWIDSRTR